MCRDEWRFNKCPRINEDLTFTKLFKDRALYIIRIWINLSLDLTGGVLGYSFHLSQAKFIHSPFGIRSLMRIIWNHCIVGPLIINLSNLSIIADCQQALIIDHNVLSAIIKWQARFLLSLTPCCLSNDHVFNTENCLRLTWLLKMKGSRSGNCPISPQQGVREPTTQYSHNALI